MRRIVRQLTVLALFLGVVPPSSAEVFVSRTFSTDVSQQQASLGAGQFRVWPLGGGLPGDVYDVQVNLGNAVYRDISAMVVDEQNLQLFRLHQPYRAHGKQKGLAPFSFRAGVEESGPHYLILDNSYAMLIAKKAAVGVRLTHTLSDKAASDLQSLLEKTDVLVHRRFVSPDFNITVRPCGQANAFSNAQTGDITLCSETISLSGGKPGLLLGIFFHELGHTLLNLWGLPGADNEDVADEFATVLMLQLPGSGQPLIEQWLTFFENQDAYSEAVNVIKNGDRHTLSIQRIRNIRASIARAPDITARWNRLLYPHTTESMLRQIANRPSVFDDASLAASELAKR